MGSCIQAANLAEYGNEHVTNWCEKAAPTFRARKTCERYEINSLLKRLSRINKSQCHAIHSECFAVFSLRGSIFAVKKYILQ